MRYKWTIFYFYYKWKFHANSYTEFKLLMYIIFFWTRDQFVWNFMYSCATWSKLESLTLVHGIWSPGRRSRRPFVDDLCADNIPKATPVHHLDHHVAQFLFFTIDPFYFSAIYKNLLCTYCELSKSSVCYIFLFSLNVINSKHLSI